MTAATVAVLVVTLIAVQYARAIGENIAAAHQLGKLQADIATLERERDFQQREVRRLRDPQGAIPEIHDRLRLVRPNEAIIFVRTAPSPTP